MTVGNDQVAAGELNDHVIHELFALGLGLQGLARNTTQPAQLSRIEGCVDTVDALVRTIRCTTFAQPP